MIPKIIHQIWLGENPVPDQFRVWSSDIQKKHPDWEYRFWTDENIQEFDAKALLEECESFAAKSDVIRLLAVAKYGGVYLDMDIECLKPLDTLINVSAFAARESKKNICNAVFGAARNHHSVLRQIHELPDCVYKPTTWGVELMTKEFSKLNSGVTLYPKEFFYPYLWDMPREYRILHPETFLVHHWEKSWCK